MRGTEETGNSLDEWLQNPYWAEYYNGAPSERCRSFIALEFSYSDHANGETAEAMDRIEEEMDIAELRHLLKYCGENPERKRLQDRITALERG